MTTKKLLFAFFMALILSAIGAVLRFMDRPYSQEILIIGMMAQAFVIILSIYSSLKKK